MKTAADLRPSRAIETQMAEYSLEISDRIGKSGMVETSRGHGAVLNEDRLALDFSCSERYLDACAFLPSNQRLSRSDQARQAALSLLDVGLRGSIIM
jgi:hypothetical protein